jgi:hypothetical protein
VVGAPGYSWLGEVHDVKLVAVINARVAHSVEEPLLVALCVRVDLHVKVVLLGSYSFGLKQVSRLKDAVDEQHVAIVSLLLLLLFFFEFAQELHEFARQVLTLACAEH